jgi:hypothetical protein
MFEPEMHTPCDSVQSFSEQNVLLHNIILINWYDLPAALHSMGQLQIRLVAFEAPDIKGTVSNPLVDSFCQV